MKPSHGLGIGVALLFCIGVLGNCGGSDIVIHACVPGAQQACACPNGATGAQVCNTAGSAYGTCTGCGVSLGGDLALPSNGSTDLAFAPLDFAGVVVGCNGFSNCMVACLNDPSATLAECETQCNKNAKSDAETKWESALSCGQNWCLGNPDAGGNKCALSADMTMLVDRPGDAAGTCQNCLNDALSSLFSVPCLNMSGPDCNPTACKSVEDACTNELP